MGKTDGDETGAGNGHPSEAQRRYLERGLAQAGGKLPLFDQQGREVAHKTIQTCIAHGWAEPWFANPLKPDWLVCRLTPAGHRALGRPVPDSGSGDTAGGPLTSR
jgi:hypothetical protein